MRPFLLPAVLILVAFSNVHATEALLFNGGGYTIEILIGTRMTQLLPKFSLRLLEPQTGLVFPATFFGLKSSTSKSAFWSCTSQIKTTQICQVRFPFLSKRTGLSSLLVANKLRAHSIGPCDASAGRRIEFEKRRQPLRCAMARRDKISHFPMRVIRLAPRARVEDPCETHWRHKGQFG